MKYKRVPSRPAFLNPWLNEAYPLTEEDMNTHIGMNGDDVQVVGHTLNLNQRMRAVMAHECEMSVRESCHRTRQVLPVTRKVVLSRPLCRPIDDAVPMHYVGYFVSNHPTATALRRD